MKLQIVALTKGGMIVEYVDVHIGSSINWKLKDQVDAAIRRFILDPQVVKIEIKKFTVSNT